jgi:undecaprenyl phosphate N,N'-diacetylbacillosamine 1-phosphate transferase
MASSVSIYRSGGKRALDVVVAAALALLLSPVLVVAGILVVTTSRGPMFFVQERVGRDGKVFRLFKFRTMRHGTPKPFIEVVGRHEEVTAVGYLFRRLKIDELPQLFNILRGDMSLVGPRPLVPRVAATLEDWAMPRLTVRPGVTGAAQVSGGIHITWPERWRFDVDYVDRYSLVVDLGILGKTALVVLFGDEWALRRSK